MKSEFDRPAVFYACRARRIALMIFLVFGMTLTGTGCLIIPVPSVTPDYRTGIIEDKTLESLIGLDQSEVNERIGYPDYSGHRAQTYVMVYQGESRYSTDVYAFVSGGYSGGGGKIDDGTTTTLHCYVVELDANRIVREFDVIVRPASGITHREESGYAIKPAADCSKIVWASAAQGGVLPDDVEATKQIMVQRNASEARRVSVLEARARTAELKHRARQGDTKAVIELAAITGDSKSLEVLAQASDAEAAAELAGLTGNADALRTMAASGNPAAAYAMYGRLARDPRTIVDAWKYLCSAANAGYASAQAQVGYWHRQAEFKSASDDKLTWIQERIGIQADNRTAYAWYTLAASSGNTQAIVARDHYVAPGMTREDIAEAVRMANDWMPGECPSADNRLSAPGET